MPDRFDAAVAYLTKHPQDIRMAWDGWYVHPAGDLFRPCSPGRERLADGYPAGCLTQVKNRTRNAFTPDLTSAICSLANVPFVPGDITPADLPIFAAWQRAMSAYFGGANLTEALMEQHLTERSLPQKGLKHGLL